MKSGKIIVLSCLALFLLLFLLTTVTPATGNLPGENPVAAELKVRVNLLEKALRPRDPAATAKAWAEGVKARNGAWQYALLAPELKAEYYEKLAAMNWSTGTSSPWVEKYEVTERYRVNDELYRYEVKFTYKDSTASTFTTKDYITVRRYEDAWLIAKVEKMEAEGKITKSPDGETEQTIILLANESADWGGYDRVNVVIGNETKIYKGHTDQELTVDDLQEGDRVEIAFTDEPRLMIYPVTAKAETIRKMEPGNGDLVYENTQYKLAFSLPGTWEGYRVVTEGWEGRTPDGEIVETGPVIKIRHPGWTVENPRQDIPILVFTLRQWEMIQKEKFNISAAPIGPKELGRNKQYVFALPARYNYAFPPGYEEVEEILTDNPLLPLF